MKVWVVSHTGYENDWTIEIFSSEAKAKARFDAVMASLAPGITLGDDHGYDIAEYNVE